MGGVRVGRSFVIPEEELTFRFTTSSGPGGQHANKASTRVEVLWDVQGSSVLGPRQRPRIQGALKHRIDRAGRLRVASERYRSQHRNREDAMNKLAALVADALTPQRARIATRPGAGAREQRLKEKRRRSEIKRRRRAPRIEE